MLIWSDLIVSQWPRLITGHGFDFVHQGLNYGYLPERSPRSLLFVVWYDLGLAGAAGLTVLVMLAFRSAGAIAAKAAPALLAGLVAILTIAFLGIATAQIWWVTLLELRCYRLRPSAEGNRQGATPGCPGDSLDRVGNPGAGARKRHNFQDRRGRALTKIANS